VQYGVLKKLDQKAKADNIVISIFLCFNSPCQYITISEYSYYGVLKKFDNLFALSKALLKL